MKQELTFSGKVKEELSRQWSQEMHCQIAEMAAIISMCGKISIDSRERYSIKVRTENLSVARKYFTLLKKTFNIDTETFVSTNRSNENVTYTVIVKQHEDAIRVLQASKLIDGYGEIRSLVVKNSCCKRAFLRGAFLANGSMSNPEKSYHMEIVCAMKERAKQIQMLINSFELDAKVILRKKSYVVYLKEGAQIVDLLNIIGAPVALMNMENIRIVKEMRNSVNRKVNCETANLGKTVQAAVKQVEDIQFIQQKMSFRELPKNLQEIAELRLAYPNASLKELGELLSEPIGKSGVNHRLRKLSEIAQELRENKEEQKW